MLLYDVLKYINNLHYDYLFLVFQQINEQTTKQLLLITKSKQTTYGELITISSSPHRLYNFQFNENVQYIECMNLNENKLRWNLKPWL